MIKYYCDRCGKEVNKEEFRRIQTSSAIDRVTFKINFVSKVSGRTNMIYRSPELCEECHKEIEKRLDGFEPFTYAIEQGDPEVTEPYSTCHLDDAEEE